MTKALRRTSWLTALMLIGLMTPVSAMADLVRLHGEDFPCDTFPPKCPESLTDFVAKVQDLFEGEVIPIDIPEQIDIDSGGVCDELYIEAGGHLELSVAGLAAVFEYIRDPVLPYFDHLRTDLQLADVSLGGDANLVGENCLLFIDFSIPIGGGIHIDDLLMQSRTTVWLDDAADKVELQDEYSGAVIGGLTADLGLPALVEFLVDLIVPFIANTTVADAIEETLLVDGGIVFDMVEDLMDNFYHTVPCGCLVVPGRSYPAGKLAGHVAVNLGFYLLPVGLILVLRRKLRK